MDKTLEQCYETLGLSVDASKEEVRKAYKKLALKCHPDKNQNSPEANRKFQELGYAYKRITEDEELEDIDEDCSEYDYWTEVFFYCFLKEHFQVRRNRKHCCPNCAQYTDEDEEFFEDLYQKHTRKQKEMTFTDEEMKHFVKFNSLKEQREFNKKTFCDSKKSSKPKNEPKVQKVKTKTNKQLKAEQWKREKEISKIAREIEIKNQQEEQKKYIKECKELKKEKEKEKLESTKNGIEIKEQVNGNKQQSRARHKEQLSKENKTGDSIPTKHKSKKKHKKVRAKPEDNNTQKCSQEHKTRKSTTPPSAKPPASSSIIKSNAKQSKPAAPVFRPPKQVQQPAKRPTPITLPQPPNIWMKRLETQNEIREIQPTNEEEELRQLEIALEMSKKQVEIEEQQKQIAALQEEIRLMSLEQEKLGIHEDNPEDISETVAFIPDCEMKSDVLTDVENCNEKLANNDFNSNEVSVDFQMARPDEQGRKQLNNNSDSDTVDDSSEKGCDGTCNTDSTLGEKYTSLFHEPQNQFFRSCKNSKGQTQACASREKNNTKERKPCPYGKNCCLGKKCKYSHFVAKGEGGLNHNQSLCSEVKQHKLHDLVDTEIIDEVEYDKMENSLLVTEDWDDEIENNQVISSASHYLQSSPSSSSVTEGELWQTGQNSYSVESNEDGKHSNSWEEKEDEKKPVISLQFDFTNEICTTEDWDHEIEDSDGLDPPITGKGHPHTKYLTLMTEMPYEEVQGFKARTSNDRPMVSGTSNTIKPSMPILSGEGNLRCYGKDKTTPLFEANREGMSNEYQEETGTNWEEQSHATSVVSMKNIQHQEPCTKWQDEWDESLVKDTMNNEIHCNDSVGKQSRNIPLQAAVDDANIKHIPCHQNTVSGMCPVINDSVQCSQKQFQTNPRLSQGPNQGGPNQRGPNQLGPNQLGPNQPGPNQQGPNQLRPNQNQQGPNPLGPNQLGPNQLGPNQQGPNQQGPNQQGPNQQGPNQLGPNQPGPNQQGPNQLGQQHCLPFPSVGMPGVFMGGTVVPQTGLYNIPQMPSLFTPQLNYPYVQSGVNPQASLLPKAAPGYHPEGSNHSGPASMSATPASGTLKTTDNSTHPSISSIKPVPDLNIPNFPVLPNMYYGYQGNTPSIFGGVPSNMNNVPNLQQSPLMAVPFPVIPGFLPPLPLSSNNLLNMSSAVGKESNDNLQKLEKLASGPVSDCNVNYQSSTSWNPSVGSANGHSFSGPNPIQSNPLMALESNYHSILEMQMNGAPQIDLMSRAKEHTSMPSVGQEDRRIVETRSSQEEKKTVCQSEFMKKNEDMLKINDIRKPSTVPKALSYAERHH